MSNTRNKRIKREPNIDEATVVSDNLDELKETMSTVEIERKIKEVREQIKEVRRIASEQVKFLEGEELKLLDRIKDKCSQCGSAHPKHKLHHCAEDHLVCDKCVFSAPKKCQIFFYRSDGCKRIMCYDPKHSMVIDGSTYCIRHGKHYKEYGPDSP